MIRRDWVQLARVSSIFGTQGKVRFSLHVPNDLWSWALTSFGGALVLTRMDWVTKAGVRLIDAALHDKGWVAAIDGMGSLEDIRYFEGHSLSLPKNIFETQDTRRWSVAHKLLFARGAAVAGTNARFEGLYAPRGGVTMWACDKGGARLEAVFNPRHFADVDLNKGIVTLSDEMRDFVNGP